MSKKYELTNETKTLADGTVLHRIRALRDIPRFGVKAGELGGFVEGENNLSQDGDALVSGDAKVYGYAKVSDYAWVSGDACVSGNADIYGNAKVYGKARVSGNAKVSDYAKVYGDAEVYGDACVSGDAKVYGNAEIYGDAEVSGYAWVFGDAWVSGDACVSGNACVYGNADIYGDAEVSGYADYMVIKNTWSSGRWFTYTRSNKKWAVGCFYGTGEELVAKAYKDSELSGKCYEAIVRAVETIETAKAEAKETK